MSAQTQAAIVGHANQVASRWLKRGASVDRVNRYLGRVDAIRTRIAARAGDLVPPLYVELEPSDPSRCGGDNVDRHWLTTWTGKRVGLLELTGKARGFHGVKLYCYSAVIEGRRYYGRGQGPGMYLNLKPAKRA
jgi:hypothetical protein